MEEFMFYKGSKDDYRSIIVPDVVVAEINIEVKEDVGGYPYVPAIELYDYDNDKPLAKRGDKVKIIIIKQ